MTTKFSSLLVAVVMLQLVAGAAHGALVYDQTFTNGFANGGYVSDNNPSGWADNRTWTLFLADHATGDQSQVTSWNLQIEAVPEAATWALQGFGAVFAGAGVARRWQAGSAPAK